MGLYQKIIFIYFVSICTLSCDGYRILGIFPFNGKSHNIMFDALMKGLAIRGHQVDVITHYPLKNPPENYRAIINLNGTLDAITNNYTFNFAIHLGSDSLPFIAKEYGNNLCKRILSLDKMQAFIKNLSKGPKYDAVIVEVFGANCMLGFTYLLKAPMIAMSSTTEYPWISHFIGNADNLAIVPTTFTKASGKLDFWGRLKNVYLHYSYTYRFFYMTEESQTESMRKYLEPSIPDVREAEKEIALTLVNCHLSLEGIRSLLPSVVPVAGLHVEENDEKLYPEIRKWMDDSTNGVVYFSLGSMVTTESLPHSTLLILYRSFAKLSPVRVLMKVAEIKKLPPGVPKNVLTLPWTPQIPILAHNNTRLFITHGGLMGCQEALFYGVPMIGFPLFADQTRNVEIFVRKNMSLVMDLKKITEDSFDAALKDILTDSKYRNYAKHHSKLFRDRPMSAMDTAVFWIKYVIRNGKNSLKSPALEFYWWQLALLDVYLFILLCIISTMALTYLLIKLILRIFRGTPKIVDRQDSRKKSN